MLHGIPPEKNSAPVRAQSVDTLRRRGYESLATEPPSEDRLQHEELNRLSVISSSRDAIVQSGWKVLGWSFMVSGAMTVIQLFEFFPILSANSIHDF